MHRTAVDPMHTQPARVLYALMPGAPRELRITGDVTALDSLDVRELERVARRVR